MTTAYSDAREAIERVRIDTYSIQQAPLKSSNVGWYLDRIRNALQALEGCKRELELAEEAEREARRASRPGPVVLAAVNAESEEP